MAKEKGPTYGEIWAENEERVSTGSSKPWNPEEEEVIGIKVTDHSIRASRQYPDNPQLTINGHDLQTGEARTIFCGAALERVMKQDFGAAIDGKLIGRNFIVRFDGLSERDNRTRLYSVLEMSDKELEDAGFALPGGSDETPF